jgi:hypothetical protein
MNSENRRGGRDSANRYRRRCLVKAVGPKAAMLVAQSQRRRYAANVNEASSLRIPATSRLSAHDEHDMASMLHFVLKMFAGGYASLPRGGDANDDISDEG